MQKHENIVFLDYDGVVNTMMWNADGTKCDYNFASDGKVNNFQACQWVSEFCQNKGYSIVVTSTWRRDPMFMILLKQGGLRDGIRIYGGVPCLEGKSRADEIVHWLNEHPFVKNYIIFDDEDCHYTESEYPLSDHLVLCDTTTGFTYNSYVDACEIHDSGKTRKEW